MPEKDQDVTILLADIAGSTQLYERVGDDAALRQVVECIDGLSASIVAEGGTIVHSKGDDVLASFTDPSAGLRAVRRILSRDQMGPLAIHAGLHFGNIIHARGDIYGDAVNLTARLAALAKPGEALMSERFVSRLPDADAQTLQALDEVSFKGKSAPIAVYSLLGDETALRTQFAFAPVVASTGRTGAPPARDVTLILRYGARAHVCKDSMSVSIGRSPDCDVLIERPWVSRKHATIMLQQGKVQLADLSTSGTYVSMRGGEEFFLRRETVTLVTGSGTISPTLPSDDPNAEVIQFEADHDETSDA